MPDIARILPFPVARTASVALTPANVIAIASRYWDLEPEARSHAVRNRTLANPDVLVSVFGLLRDNKEFCPRQVAEEASAIYSWIASSDTPLGVFDERDYFLAESAYLAGISCRLLGQREEATRWIDRAEAKFRHTLNPAPGLTNIAYTRLALRYEMGDLNHVLDLVPSLRTSFQRLGMSAEAAKCILLEAMTLKGLGRVKDALDLLEPVQGWGEGQLDSSLRGRIVSELGDLYQLDDRFDLAMKAYSVALSLLQKQGTSQALADLKMFVGEAHRQKELLPVALEAFRAAAADYQELGLETRLAYLRVFIADTLLKLGRNREAEWELLAALPVIEEQKMVPEGFAAVALLKESVRRRQTDPSALRELREHLQAKK